MQSKKAFADFVQDTVVQIKDFQQKNPACLKQIIREAIAYYQLKTVVKLEETKTGEQEVIYLASAAEETILTKIIEIASNDDEISLEALYNSQVIRRH